MRKEEGIHDFKMSMNLNKLSQNYENQETEAVPKSSGRN
jgi:hypothetical protein